MATKSCGNTGSAKVTFTATDKLRQQQHNNGNIYDYRYNSPSINTTAKDQTVNCDGAGNTAQLQAWLEQCGTSSSDGCSGVRWSNNYNWA